MKNEKNQRLLRTIFYYVAFIGLGLASGVLGPSLLRLAENTSSSIGQVSTMFVFHALGYMTGSLLGGRGYDRFRGHPIMTIMLVIIAASLALTPLINLLWLLMVVMFLLGASQGALDVGGNTLLVWVHGQKVGPFMNGLHLFFGIGAFAAPILVAQAVRIEDSLTLAYWIMALFMLIPAVGLLFLQSPTHQANPDDPERQGARSNLLLLGMIVLFFLLYVGVETGFTSWIFSYASTSGLLNETSAAYATSLFWGAFTLGRLLSIPIAVKMPPRKVLLMDVLGCLASVVILLILPRSLPALWISIIGTGLFAASVFPTMISFAENRLHLTGRTTSMFFVGASIGGMFFPWLIGQFYESIGPIMVPITITASSALLLILYSILVKRFPSRQPKAQNNKPTS